MELSIVEVAKGWVGIVGGIFFYVASGVKFYLLSMLVHDAFLADVQRSCCHVKHLVQWSTLMLKGLAGCVASPSRHLITQIGTHL
jgi:hypothetical protein